MDRSLGTLPRASQLLTSRGVIRAVAAMLIVATELPAKSYRARVSLPAYPNAIALDTIAIRSEFPAPRLGAFQVTAAVLQVELKIGLKIYTEKRLIVVQNRALSRYASASERMRLGPGDKHSGREQGPELR